MGHTHNTFAAGSRMRHETGRPWLMLHAAESACVKVVRGCGRARQQRRTPGHPLEPPLPLQYRSNSGVLAHLRPAAWVAAQVAVAAAWVAAATEATEAAEEAEEAEEEAALLPLLLLLLLLALSLPSRPATVAAAVSLIAVRRCAELYVVERAEHDGTRPGVTQELARQPCHASEPRVHDPCSAPELSCTSCSRRRLQPLRRPTANHTKIKHALSMTKVHRCS